MRGRKSNLIASLLAGGCAMAGVLVVPALAASQQIPAGSRFLVELQDSLEAGRIKPGKKFEARTLDVLETTTGTIIPPDTKMQGRVIAAEGNKLVLRFERIETRWGKLPLSAAVVSVFDGHDAKRRRDEIGETQAQGNRSKDATVSAMSEDGIGIGTGDYGQGGKTTAREAESAALPGTLIRGAAGGKNLVLRKGTCLELQLIRPLVLIRGR